MADDGSAVAVDPGSPAQAASAPPQEPVAVPSPAAPAAPPAPATVDWAGHIPPELAKEKMWDSLKGKPLADVLKNYADAQRYLGNVVALPKKDAKPEEITAWKKETMGKLAQAGLLEAPPAKPEEYVIERPPIVAELGWSDDREADFRKAAHGIGLTQSQVQALVNWQAQDLGRLSQDVEAQLEEATMALQAEWGANFDAKLGRGEQFINAYFDGPTREAIKKSVGRTPGFIKGVIAAASRMAEHGDLPGTVEGQPSSADLDRAIAENRERARTTLNPAERVRLAEELHGLYQQRLGDDNRVHTKIE